MTESEDIEVNFKAHDDALQKMRPAEPEPDEQEVDTDEKLKAGSPKW